MTVIRRKLTFIVDAYAIIDILTSTKPEAVNLI